MKKIKFHVILFLVSLLLLNSFSGVVQASPGNMTDKNVEENNDKIEVVEEPDILEEDIEAVAKILEVLESKAALYNEDGDL